MATTEDIKKTFNLESELADAKKQFESLTGDLNQRYMDWYKEKVAKVSSLEMSEHDAWLFERSLGIGGSDIGALLSMSPYNTRFMLYQDKALGLVEFTGNNFTKWGNKLEHVIGENFAEEFNLPIEQSPPSSSGIMDGSHWLRFNIDFDIPNSVAMGEVKTATGESKADWGQGITPDMIDISQNGEYIIIEPNGLDINTIDQCEFPLAYFCQMQYYLMMKSKLYCFLTVLIGGNDERHYLICANQDFQHLIYYRATYFMFHNIIENHIPLKTPFEQMQDYIACDHSGEVDTADHTGLKDKLIDFYNINSLYSELGNTKREMEDEIKMLIGDKTEIVEYGETLANWNTQTRISIDKDALEDEHPELFEKYKKEKVLRVLRLKKKHFKDDEDAN